MTIADILLRLQNVTTVNGGWQCKCPAHPDDNPSLSISEGKDGRILLHCHAGCTTEQIVAAMGLQMTDLFQPKEKPRIVEIYDYTNENGVLLFQKCKYFPKDYRLRRPDGNNGFKWNMKGVERVMFRLPELIAAKAADKIVFVAEGEKDANAFSRFDLFATCNPGGASEWLPKFAESLYGARIVVVADKDKVGREHAQKIAESLHGKVKALLVMEMPNRDNHKVKDFYDWIVAGGTKEELRDMVIKAPQWTPPIKAEPIEKQNHTPGEHLNYDLEFVENDKGKIKPVAIPIPFNETMDRIMAKVQDQLARVDNLMFAKPDILGGEIHYIENPAALFGRLGVHNKTTIDWTGVAKAMKKEEAFAEITRKLTLYRGIETAPHHPIMAGLYYNYPELPEPDNEALSNLISRFCPETDEDKAFILSMFLTALWGGGERPAFIISSKDGRGSGKSTIGEMLSEVLGQQPTKGSTKNSIEDLKTRLLSPAGLTSRIVIFDNETGRVSSGELSAEITSPTISGRRLYVGEGRRPNNLLWIITLNTPSLDSDLASRCVVISVKKPEYSSDWRTGILQFIETHRWGIVSALLNMLKQETPHLASCRWSAWENEVLSKVHSHYSDLPKLQSLFMERQRDFDDEADEISLIRDGFIEAVRVAEIEIKQYSCFFKNALAANIYNEVTGAHVRKNTALREIKNMIRMGSIKELIESEHGVYGRGFVWTSDTAFEDKVQLITRPEPAF